MKKLNYLLLAAGLCAGAFAVSAQTLTTTPSGGNKKASVMERIGITDVTVTYDRPAVKGREGKIWGQLVHYGFKNLGFGSAKESPWRAGANENTTISFSTDVKIEGKDLPAGKYGLFMAMAPTEATVIFSKDVGAWGSYFYNPDKDALRVTVKTYQIAELVERLKYEFMDQTDNSATVALEWERLKIPFKIEVDLGKTMTASFRQELEGDKGFMWQNFQYAANFAAQHNTNLDEALVWANNAADPNYGGEKNFTTLATKAEILNKMGKMAEADALMKEASGMGKMQELHQYGRQLLAQKKNKEALDIFKMNAAKNPNQFTTYMGLARGYSANGDYKMALQNAKAALPMAPDDANKQNIQAMISKLSEGKDVN